MFLRCFRAEDRKLHASPIWILFFLLPVISAVYGTFNYLQNLGILQDQWYSLWTQHTLFYALFFYPVLVGVYAAYLWRLEHRGHNWNLIMAAPVRPLALFLAKYVVVLKLVLLTQLLVFGLYRLAAGADAAVFAARAGGRPVRDRLAAGALDADPQFCGAGVYRLGGRRGWYALRQQRRGTGVPLCADAGRHERQQERGPAGRAVWRVFAGFGLVAGAVFGAGAPAADAAGRARLNFGHCAGGPGAV